ncbi:MAG: glutamine-hydrolyzing GMP synthase [Marinilabiliaceae bacterium]|nr:glutamine-hydrolyzing GMP synthase [Marinilabiliaceae bacterium]
MQNIKTDDWSPESFIDTTIENLKQELGNDRVILAISGGVDSTVTAMLLHKAIGNNLTSIFVDHGLLRKNEFENVLRDYKEIGLNVIGIDAKERFYKKLSGVTDPEQKRKIIGKEFIDIFEEEANKLDNIQWLAQGTIYPDVLESQRSDGTIIKSHHNVGGLPEKMKLKLVEPLRTLYKNEVRIVGQTLGILTSLINRHPFPGPGLGVRILGDITAEKVHILQEADHIFIQQLKNWYLYDKVWQAAAILLPIKAVGMKDNNRTYENVIVLRAVKSTDAMTADVVFFSNFFFEEVSNKIINNVKGVNRVVYDISSKPPATIEWE